MEHTKSGVGKGRDPGPLLQYFRLVGVTHERVVPSVSGDEKFGQAPQDVLVLFEFSHIVGGIVVTDPPRGLVHNHIMRMVFPEKSV